jgi:hypothetical protein
MPHYLPAFIKYNQLNTIIAVNLLLVLTGCSGYQRGMRQYNQYLVAGKYQQALQFLDKASFLQNNRNQFLYHAEKGRLMQLNNLPDSSTHHLNVADEILEESWKQTGDAIKSNLINPMLSRYIAPDMERMMLHYCKGLTYLGQGNTNAALVEARRISLQANRILDTKMRGAQQALGFGYWVQGLIYESAGQWNDAFIAYRNAADQYIKKGSDDRPYADNMPPGWLNDVIRTARFSGFNAGAEWYSKLLNLNEQPLIPEGGWLIAIHEAGTAPVYENIYFSFNSFIPGTNDMYFSDRYGYNVYPVYMGDFSSYSVSPLWFKGLRVATAVPVPAGNTSFNATLQSGSKTFSFDKVLDMYTWASRPERMSREITNAIIRAIVKKGTEIAAQESARAIAKSAAEKEKDDKNKSAKEKDAEKKKDAANADAIAAGVGLLFNLVNQSTEVADTRGWRSLPGAIYIARIPLEKGPNTITLQNGKKPVTLTINGDGKVQAIRL